MAVVGEARIIVRAITTGVGAQISDALKNAERGMANDGKRMGRTLGDGFQKGFSGRGFDFGADQAIKTSDAWASLQRTGMVLQAGVGQLLGSVSALVGGLGALVGAAGAASGALAAVGGAAVGLGIGMKLAGMALGGIGAAFNKATSPGGKLKKTLAEIREEMQQLRFEAEDAALSEKDAALNLEKARNNLARMQDLPPNSMARREAELELEKADLAFRKAKDRTKDLNDQIKNGGKDSAGGGGIDPYAGLTKSQKEFAKALVALKPKFDALKEAVASGFLPALRTQIETMMGKNFPHLELGFKKIGDALGAAVTEVGNFINSAKGMSNLDSIFDTSGTVIATLGKALASGLEAFTDILRVAAPLTKTFVEWIASKADAFKNFIINKEATGELQHFFDRAGIMAGKFGKIFGNIFKGLGKVIGANFEKGSGGDMMLDWLITATDKFANLDKTVGGAGALNKYFQDAVTNSKAILGSIGALIKELLALGTMPEIKQFWDTLKEGAPAMGTIFREGVKASPILAQIIVDVTKIVAALADSTAIKVFFTILQKVTGALSAIFNNETVKTIIDATAAVAAIGLAFGFLWSKAALVGQLFVGLGTKIGMFFGASQAAAFNFAKIWAGPIFLAIALIIGAFANLYKNNEAFKAQVDGFMAAFQTLFSGISASAQSLGPSLQAFFDTFSTAMMPIFITLMNTIQDLFPYIQQLADIFFKDLLPVILQVAGQLLSSLLPALGSILSAVLPLIPIILNSLMPALQLLAEAFVMIAPQIASLVTQIVDALVPVIVSLMGVLVPIIQLVVELASSIIQMLVPIIQTVVEVFMVLLPIITGIITVIADLATVIFSVLGPILNVIVQVLTFLARLITGVVVAAFKLFATIIATVFNGISIGVKAMQDGFKWAMNQMIGFAEGFVNFFVDGLNWIIGLLNKIKIDIPAILRPLVGGTKSIGFNINPLQKVRLARLAEGGTVYPSSGGSIVNVAEAGQPERIEPLDANGLSKRDIAMIRQLSGNGMQITVNAGPGMDENELANMVSRKIAFEMRKGSI